ncbi:AAA family ATPase [Actinomyces sp. zg328]|uniref:AAA family ATPase n=1 Tax=Actinomyces sp. zg328 TaxID=2609287 RepID=UPI001358374F|nr:ATP-binding protein [Actinomyces sp. zg328]
MKTARLTELRLTCFKSFRDAVVPLDGMTVLTGRNSSGKSNVLDALDVLSRLATPERLRDSLDGHRREGGPVRGGAKGLAPHGESSFTLGCTVRVSGADGAVDYLYDVEVEAGEEPGVVAETLKLQGDDQQDPTPLLTALSGDDEEELTVAIGPLPAFKIPRSFTALSFFPGGIQTISHDPRSAEAAGIVLRTLRNAVILNADVTSMKDYVSRGRREIEPDMANLSALVCLMRSERPSLFSRLEALAREVAGCPIEALDFITANDGHEVMLALRESGAARTGARSMSDGLLRFLAIATALLLVPQSAQEEPDDGRTSAARVVAIEEIENGLHPSHAARLLELVEGAGAQAGISIIITTHSPALLDAIGGSRAEDVLVCHDGQVTRLPDLPGYDRAMARGTLGRVVSQGLLTGPSEDDGADYSDFLRLVGAM